MKDEADLPLSFLVPAVVLEDFTFRFSVVELLDLPDRSSSFILPPSSFLSALIQRVAAFAVKVVEIFGLDCVEARSV